jgi:IS30 family transposase
VGEDRSEAGRNLDRALTVAQAADALGVSQDAVRKRIRRRTIQSEKDETGRIYVYVPASETVHKTVQDTGKPGESGALISQLRDEVAYLRDENRRKDEIIIQQAMTMRQLAPPSSQEATESAETATDSPSSTPAPPEPQRQSWWRRLLGG